MKQYHLKKNGRSYIIILKIIGMIDKTNKRKFGIGYKNSGHPYLVIYFGIKWIEITFYWNKHTKGFRPYLYHDINNEMIMNNNIDASNWFIGFAKRI